MSKLKMTIYNGKEVPEFYAKKERIINMILESGKIGDCLNLLSVPFHEEVKNKIFGLTSIPSSSSACEFCEQMRKNHDSNWICNYCYDYKQEQYRINVKFSHMINVEILSQRLYDETDFYRVAYRLQSRFIRVNCCGDFSNVTHIRNIIRLCRIAKDHVFTCWTKNLKDLNFAIELENGKPENMRIIFSDPVINGIVPANYRKMEVFKNVDCVFVVLDKFHMDHVITFKSKKGFICNGKHCFECGYACYDGSVDRFDFVYELFRT